MRARAFNVPGQRQPLLAWQLADISRERAEQERFFLDLQKAIDHLDHAPAGFFSADQEGRVTYINATLAEWLGIDLASFTPGATTLQEIVAGDGMALVRSVKADPGTTRNAVIDLDLATVAGEALPVRFMHRVSASRDGLNGPTRTIVLNRTQGEDASAELRASEVRFTRFFNSTPMAIAGVDQHGRILRTNAPFLSLVLGGRRPRRSRPPVRLDTVIHERDRAAFAAALEKARQRQADIAPIDTRAARTTRTATSASTSMPLPTAPAARAPRSPRSSMPWRRPSRRRWKARWRKARRCRRSASLPAASRTTSTTCSPPSSWRPTFC